MMHDEEAASPQWKLNLKNFGSNKVHKIFRVGVKTRVGQISRNNKFV